jgi:hypothetical protein
MNPNEERNSRAKTDAEGRFGQAERLMQALGAQSTAHVTSDLLTHLRGTAAILLEWGASEDLRLAGLCHAAYGTDGFPAMLLPIGERARLENVIGERAEQIVYTYCACQRDDLFETVATNSPLHFRNRFVESDVTPPDQMLRDFFELTFANEIELCRGNPAFRLEHERFFRKVFPHCRPYVSRAAFDSFEAIFPNASTDGIDAH